MSRDDDRRGTTVTGAVPTVSTPDDLEIERAARGLCAHLGGIRTDELRSQAAATALLSHPPYYAVLLVGRILLLARSTRPAADAVAALSRALSRDLVDADFIADCRALAHSKADRLAETFFAVGPALRRYDSRDEVFVDRKLTAIPLGERRALSKARDIDLLTRLAHDQDPRVIRNLLINPRFTEAEAIRVAARRPTHVHVLEEVLASRFGQLARVRRAVAHNPYTPIALAVAAMSPLPLQDLRALAHDDKLSSEVREKARTMWVARSPTPAERDTAVPTRLDDDEADALQDLIARLEETTDDDDPSQA